MMKYALVGAIMAAAALSYSPAHASEVAPGSDYTFTFSGQCGDCTGVGTATLEVQDYILGTPLTDANLVDFYYTSNLTTIDIVPSDDLDSVSGKLSGSINAATGSYSVEATQLFLGSYPLEDFTSSTDGTWSVSQNSYNADFGAKGVWNGAVTATPEPGVWALMFGGIAMIGGMLRLASARRRQDAVLALQGQ